MTDRKTTTIDPEFYLTARLIADMIGVSYESVRRWRYGTKQYKPFPAPIGNIYAGQGPHEPVYAFSAVIDWFLEHRPDDCHIAEEFGPIGRQLAGLF